MSNMADIAMISAALGSIKAATDIVKFLRKSDLSLEKADLKMRLADLTSALADAKIHFVEIQETLQGKEKRIQELEEAFQSKDELVRHRDAYYSINSDGKVIGVPYCLGCWEKEHKKRQLVEDAGQHRTMVCTACGHKYSVHMAYKMQNPENPF
jgi:HEAT repeat protein